MKAKVGTMDLSLPPSFLETKSKFLLLKNPADMRYSTIVSYWRGAGAAIDHVFGCSRDGYSDYRDRGTAKEKKGWEGTKGQDSRPRRCK
jgi:hypothetical protein